MEIRKITVGFEMENKNSTKASAGRKVEKGNSVHRNLVSDNLARTIRSREERVSAIIQSHPASPQNSFFCPRNNEDSN